MTAKDETPVGGDGNGEAASEKRVVVEVALASLLPAGVDAGVLPGIKELALAYTLDADADPATTIHLAIDSNGSIHPGAPCTDWTKPLRVLVSEPDAKDQRAFDESKKFIIAYVELVRTKPDADRCAISAELKDVPRLDCLEAWRRQGGLSPDQQGGLRQTTSGFVETRESYDPASAAGAAYQPAGAFTGSDAQIDKLKPHVVNLRRGKLSEGGIMRTTKADLDSLVANIARECGDGDKKLVFYAHGGLTSEESGLAAAWAYHGWWLAHGVYPVFFVWETGGLETLWQIVAAKFGRTRAVTRDIFDHTSDPAVEALAAGPGSRLWEAMKRSAELASDKDGGAAMLADKLAAAFVGKAPEIFAIGHSAGSIFHAQFLPCLLDKWPGAKIGQLHLLAPAITHKLYEDNLRALKLDTHMFTMKRQAERDDNCGGIYRKSLLYLVSNAFEDKLREPILGMADFWPGVAGGAIQEHWSPGDDSKSTSHGGFDNDPATMESVLRLIRGENRSTRVDPGFPSGDPPRARAVASPANFYGMSDETRAMFSAPQPISEPGGAISGGVPGSASAPASGIALGGQRVALCIGNDRFPPGMELSGCVNDATNWAGTLGQLGFTAEVLPDATADRMRASIRDAVSRASPGDCVVIHISSHGTQVPDLDGDERLDDQFADDLDEAVIGIDWDRGGMIIDDEWPALLTARPGVHIARFHDFCHAGRTSRMLMKPGRRNRSVRVRDEVARRAAKASPAWTGARVARGGYAQDLPYLTFCACQPHQLSGEVNGMGLFSRAANDLLRGRGAAMTYTQLADEIGRALTGEDQQPMIEGPAAMAAMKLFGGR